MNLKEAYEKMREGKKVKRKGRSMCCFYDSKENKICTGDGLAVTGIAFEAALADDWEIVEEPKIKDWKPKKGDKYYYIGSVGSIFNYDCREDNILDEAHLNIGNYFKTEEDAKHMVEKFKVIRELQKFANENNEKEIDWKNFNQCKYRIFYDAEDENLYVNYITQCKSEPFNIYFTSLEIAKEAIKTIGKDRIKKYYFDIED